MAIIFLFLLSLIVTLTCQSALPAYEVEVYFVVDRAVVDRYVAEQTSESEADALASLNADVDYFITEINLLYASLGPKGLNIGVLKKKVDILDTSLFSDNTDVAPNLDAFDAWLLAQDAYNTVQYDAAILWTGHELWSGGDDGVAGYAHVGEICQSEDSSGIAEYDMTYRLVVTTAHELGHILGASHDSEVTGYVMIPKSSSDEANRWQFSLCSKEAFDAAMNKLSTNCLANTGADSTSPEADVTDALADPDTICRRSEDNQDSFMCKSSFFYNDSVPQGDQVCKRVWCKNVGSSFCNSAFASDGLICGTNKRCDDGTCQDHPDAESGAVENECIWGDQAEVTFTTSQGTYTGDCPGFIDAMGKSMCNDDVVATPCCQTCEDLKTGIEGCDYGDQYHSCGVYTQAQICDNYGDICCEFCHGYTGKRSAGGSSGVTLDPTSIGVKVKDNLKANPDPPRENSPPHEQP